MQPGNRCGKRAISGSRNLPRRASNRPTTSHKRPITSHRLQQDKSSHHNRMDRATSLSSLHTIQRGSLMTSISPAHSIQSKCRRCSSKASIVAERPRGCPATAVHNRQCTNFRIHQRVFMSRYAPAMGALVKKCCAALL